MANIEIKSDKETAAEVGEQIQKMMQQANLHIVSNEHLVKIIELYCGSVKLGHNTITGCVFKNEKITKFLEVEE